MLLWVLLALPVSRVAGYLKGRVVHAGSVHASCRATQWALKKRDRGQHLRVLVASGDRTHEVCDDYIETQTLPEPGNSLHVMRLHRMANQPRFLPMIVHKDAQRLDVLY